MFSDYFKYLLKKLQFVFIVIIRFIKILFRRRKRIEKIYLNYATEHIFDNSYIIINYRFRNAIYYRFGKHVTLEKQIKIFDLKKFSNKFELIIYGFFQKKVCEIQFEPNLTLNNSSFKTAFSNLNLKLEERIIPKLSHQEIYCSIKEPIVNRPKIKINQPTIKISNTTFNQNEFI